jgi:hypothetical protein
MRSLARSSPAAALMLSLGAVCGCGGKSIMAGACSNSVEVIVSPTSATANHTAAPPANQAQFIGVAHPTASPPGCPVPEWVALSYGTWSNPDPSAIQISSANNSTNGTAVCLAPTSGAVTLTGTFTQSPLTTPATVSVQLTCE